MFSQVWFWLIVVAHIFASLLFTGNGTRKLTIDSIAVFSIIGIIVFCILAAVFSEKWWYGPLTLLISYFAGAVIASYFKKASVSSNNSGSILSNIHLILVLIGVILAPVSVIAAYLFLFL